MIGEQSLRELAADLDVFGDEVAEHYDEVVTYLLDKCPVAKGADGYYLLSRYDDVRACALDADFIAGQGTLKPRPPGMRPQFPMETDPPFHTALRRPLTPFFSPGVTEQYEPLIERIAHELIDGFAEGGCDAITKFCRPLPGQVMFSGLLDLPLELVEPLGKAVYQMFSGKPGGAKSFSDGVDAVLAHHAAKPAPGGVMGAILALEVDGAPVSHDVQNSLVSTLIVGGLETTTSVLSQAVHYLGTHPEDRDALAAEPNRMNAAVEEFLRLFAPAWVLGRVATQPRVVAEQRIEPGDFVYLGWGPASRDPAHFPDPLRWNPERGDKSHLAFGVGRHRCVGAPIATLGLVVALRVLLARVPRFTIPADFSPRYSRGVNRTIARLPIRY